MSGRSQSCNLGKLSVSITIPFWITIKKNVPIIYVLQRIM